MLNKRIFVAIAMMLVCQIPLSVLGQSVSSEFLKRGQANYDVGNYEEALDELANARRDDPQSSSAAYYLGLTYKKMQRYSEAIAHLKSATMLQPSVNESFVELADTYYAMDRIDEALHAIEVAEQMNVEPAQTQYLRGLILIRKGKNEEAKKAFERVRTTDTVLAVSADYQLAMLLQKSGQNAEALEKYRSVAAAQPDSDIGALARQQADAIASGKGVRRRYSLAADIQYQWDSNVILKPDSQTTTTISNEKDSSLLLSVLAEYAALSAGPAGLAMQYNYFMTSYAKLKAYNMQSHTVGIIPSYRVGNDSINMGISGNYIFLDNTAYMRSLGIAPLYSHPLGEDQYIQASIRYKKNDYLLVPFESEDRSGRDVAVGAAWIKTLNAQKGNLTFHYEWNKESTAGVNWSYIGNKLSLGLVYPLMERVQGVLHIDTFMQDYDHENTNFSVGKRKDTITSASAQGLVSLTPTMDAHVRYQFSKDSSNIDVYSYSKHIVGIGLNAKF